MITRIRELLEARQLSPTQFADLIGVGRPVISHILSERNKPSLEVVQKIIGAFPELSMPWLLAGTGPMLAAAAATPFTAPASPAAEAMQPPVSASIADLAGAFPPPVASPTRPAASARSFAVSHPTSYPQPPKFRPSAAATPATVEASAPPTEVSVSTADTVTAASPLPSPAPPAPVVTTSMTDSAVIAPVQVPLSPPPATLPAATESLRATSSPVAPATEAPALPTSLGTTALPPNPAAALSFLGEPGKAIRRIVIFYHDGSFSDYLPEGN